MCLAIPGQIVEIVDETNRLAKVDVAGVHRNVNVGLLDEDGVGVQPGDWVLIHVGFAISQGRRGRGARHARPARAHGRRLRAGARGAQGERDRVTRMRRRITASRAVTTACRCRSCASTSSAGSRCAPTTTARKSTVEIALVDARRARRPRPRPRRRGAGAAVKFVDEFRDADLGRAVATEILGAVEPGRHYKIMEVCGGHTHSIYKYGIDDLLPANVELVHGPGLPGLRDPDGPPRRRHRHRPQARGDLHLLRRHDARPRVGRHAARGQGRGRRHPHGLLAAGRAADRQAEPRPRGRLLRHRLRDDRAVDGADAQARQGRGRAQLLLRLQPRDDRAAAAGAARFARTCAWTASSAPATSPPSWARGRSSSSPPTTASRWSSRASSRWTSCRRSG